MKAVIIGGGSIGKRHATNLESLNIKTRIIDIDEISNIESILNEGFNFGFCGSRSVEGFVKFSLSINDLMG